MSINNYYFNKNNTLISRSYTNTGRNPVTEIFYGSLPTSDYPNGYSRFIFNLDLDLLKSKVQDGTIFTGGTSTTTHILRMTNTVAFNPETLNTTTSQARQRATSFDLILFRIPDGQYWDEGVGYDFADLKYNYVIDKNFSNRPSNWYQTTTLSAWTENGIYSNNNTGTTNYNNLTIVDTQTFEFGNENISFDMSNEIDLILNGSLPLRSGWGIAFNPQIENLTGLTDAYEVSFFKQSRHLQNS